MEPDAESLPAPYVNRPPGHAQIWRGRLATLPGPYSGRRAVDRVRLALRAYEQRAQRRIALREWLLARRRG